MSTRVYRARKGAVMASGYSEAGASIVRRALKGFKAFSSHPYMDIDFNNKTMRQRGRMLYMSAPVATSGPLRQSIKPIW